MRTEKCQRIRVTLRKTIKITLTNKARRKEEVEEEKLSIQLTKDQLKSTKIVKLMKIPKTAPKELMLAGTRNIRLRRPETLKVQQTSRC